jgi:hypothetical protein
MLTHSRLALATLAAALLLSLAVGSASARRFTFSTTRWTAIWERAEPFTVFSPGNLFEPIRCPMTISGTFHSRTISKVSGQLIGYIDRATIDTAACVGGTLRIIAAKLPWHVRYDSFTGTLPRIGAIQIQFINMGVETGNGEGCQYVTSATRPGVARFIIPEGSTVTSRLRWQRTFEISNVNPLVICPLAAFEESGQGRVLSGTETGTSGITVGLVQ